MYNIMNGTTPKDCMLWDVKRGIPDRPQQAYMFVSTAHLPDGYWTLTNHKSENKLERFDGTEEISGDVTGENAGRYDIYAILRGNYVAAAENIDKASEETPIDISYVITNADGACYNNFHAKQPVGWTLSQDDAFEVEYANYLPAKVGDSYFNKWQGSGNLTNRSISQTVTGLPNGKYRIGVRTSSSVIHAGAYLFANTDKADMTKLTNSMASVETEITDVQLTFGVELKNYQSNDCKFDHFTIEFLGNPVDTRIEAPQGVETKMPSGHAVFDFTGRRLARPVKGFNIVDGQKVLKW